jgi:hypothetical protein
VLTQAYAAAAVSEFLEENREEIPEGTLIGVRLLPEGQEPKNPLAFDPEQAAAEFAELERRHGPQT